MDARRGEGPVHPVPDPRLRAEQAALRRVAAVAAAGEPPEAVFDAVVAEAFTLLDGSPVSIARYESGGTEQVILAQTGDHVTVGTWFPAVDPDGISARMWKTGTAQRTDDFAGMPMQGHSRRLGVRACVAVPVVVEGSLWGSLAAASRTGPLPADTEDRLTVFAEVVATVVVSAAARTSLRVLADEQAALLRVAALVARGASEAAIFDAVATEAAGLIDDEATTLVRYEGERTFTVLATRHGPAPVGLRFTVPPGDRGTLEEMLRTGRSARVDPGYGAIGRSFSRQRFGVVSSVSVPITVHGRLWGSLGTLTEERRLPAETEGRLAKFAELVASALANAAARGELERFGIEQAALRRVAELVARVASLDEIFDAVAEQASTILGEAASNLMRFDADGRATIVAACRRTVPVGRRIPAGGDTLGGLLVRDRRPLRLTSTEATRGADHARLDLGDGGAVVAVPIVVEGRLWGGLSAVTAGGPAPAHVEERLVEFAELAAAAIASAENRAKLRASRARVVATADEARKRLQRDVHDGAQQRLVHTVLTLKLGLAAADRGEDARDLLREALEHAERATAELRDIVHGILPTALSRGGLRAGLESLVAGLSLPVSLEVSDRLPERLPPDVEVAAYFVVAEAVTNVVKHAEATHARITVSGDAGQLAVEVVDDGIGGADPRNGSGLTGLSDRIDAMDGTLLTTSPPGGGTALRFTLPMDRAARVTPTPGGT